MFLASRIYNKNNSSLIKFIKSPNTTTVTTNQRNDPTNVVSRVKKIKVSHKSAEGGTN